MEAKIFFSAFAGVMLAAIITIIIAFFTAPAWIDSSIAYAKTNIIKQASTLNLECGETVIQNAATINLNNVVYYCVLKERKIIEFDFNAVK